MTDGERRVSVEQRKTAV